MTRKSNGTEFKLDDNTKAVFDAIVKVENLRDTQVSFGVPETNRDTLLKQKAGRVLRTAKTSDMATTPIFDNITDNGSPHKYTNGKQADGNTFKATRDAGMPTARPADQPDTLINLSTEKPEFTMDQFSHTYPGIQIYSGVAYYARSGYNRHGIGTPRRFVAVMGGGESWAIYVGNIFEHPDGIATDGDKVCLEAHIKQLIDCDETIKYYRF